MMDNINDKLDDYESQSLNKVVKNNIDDVDELQQQFDDFMNQQFKKRKDADDLSISLTGLTNQQRYDIQMKELVKEDAMIDISDEQINNAKEWSADSNIIMLYPCEDIDSLYQQYLSQHKDLRRMADWKSTELYGMDNTTLYGMIKNDLVSVNIDKEDNISALGEYLIQLDKTQTTSFTEQMEINHAKKKALNKLRELTKESTYKWEFVYAPYFYPNEIFELENYYSDTVEDGVNEIFKEYANYCYGYENNFDIIKWDSEVRKLTYKLEYGIGDIDIIKQSLIKIGWNPEVKYTAENMVKAKARIENIIQESYKNISILNVESQFNAFNENEYINEAKKQNIFPISIVLVRGDSKMSDAIAKVTKGPFSHSALCLDSDFERLYSFNAKHYSNEDGGFSLESIRTYPKENEVAVFSFFVNEDQYKKINDNVQAILYNIKQSSYSFINILTMPFKHINLNMSEKMICSQFVDKMLKLIDVDITKIDSSKVTPNYLYTNCIKNSKVYKIYDGKVKDFNHAKATKYINSLSRKSKTINENFNILYEYTINQYTYPVISEARKLPLQIKDNGDILLSNPIIDFEAEYSASHKLLLQYEKSGNTEAMKYELARLYYMNYVLEKRIYSTHNKNKGNSYKTRARILNDFNKYMKIVLEKDPKFNFAKYYEASPFYANSVEVNKSTLKGVKSIINCIL